MYTDLYEIITLIFLNFSIERKVTIEATQPCRLPYMFKVNNRNTRRRFEIRSKLTIKTPQRRQWCRCCVLLLIWTYFKRCSSVSIVNFERVNAGWVTIEATAMCTRRKALFENSICFQNILIKRFKSFTKLQTTFKKVDNKFRSLF